MLKAKFYFALLLVLIFSFSTACDKKNTSNNDKVSSTKRVTDTKDTDDRTKDEEKTEDVEQTSESTKTPERTSLINPSGTSIVTRILVPSGYTRVEAEKGSFAEFVRNYELKPDKSKVYLYNGAEKDTQSAHVAVFKLPIEKYDLQQCADSIMRMYAEYYWQTKQYDKIGFHFVNGFNATYAKWIQGYTIRVSGNSVSWSRDSSCDSSYESFKKYMRMVFNYASTLSMEKESKPINIKDIQVGDIFIYGGSPGHVVMIVDVAVNAQGKKAFLIAQGFMPAQEFHILKNAKCDGSDALRNKEGNEMWYFEEDVTYPFLTPEYSFEQGSLKRPNY